MMSTNELSKILGFRLPDRPILITNRETGKELFIVRDGTGLDRDNAAGKWILRIIVSDRPDK